MWIPRAVESQLQRSAKKRPVILLNRGQADIAPECRKLLLFWRDRTREVDFVVDVGGRLELFEAKWTELPDTGDTANLNFVRNVVGKSRVTTGAVISRTPNSFPLSNGFRALPVTEIK